MELSNGVNSLPSQWTREERDEWFTLNHPRAVFSDLHRVHPVAIAAGSSWENENTEFHLKHSFSQSTLKQTWFYIHNTKTWSIQYFTWARHLFSISLWVKKGTTIINENINSFELLFFSYLLYCCWDIFFSNIGFSSWTTFWSIQWNFFMLALRRRENYLSNAGGEGWGHTKYLRIVMEKVTNSVACGHSAGLPSAACITLCIFLLCLSYWR